MESAFWSHGLPKPIHTSSSRSAKIQWIWISVWGVTQIKTCPIFPNLKQRVSRSRLSSSSVSHTWSYLTLVCKHPFPRAAFYSLKCSPCIICLFWIISVSKYLSLSWVINRVRGPLFLLENVRTEEALEWSKHHGSTTRSGCLRFHPSPKMTFTEFIAMITLLWHHLLPFLSLCPAGKTSPKSR